MKTMQVRFPDHIHERLKELAREEGISLNSFIVSSVSNEVIRQETRDFFKDAAATYDPRTFAEALATVAGRSDSRLRSNRGCSRIWRRRVTQRIATVPSRTRACNSTR